MFQDFIPLLKIGLIHAMVRIRRVTFLGFCISPTIWTPLGVPHYPWIQISSKFQLTGISLSQFGLCPKLLPIYGFGPPFQPLAWLGQGLQWEDKGRVGLSWYFALCGPGAARRQARALPALGPPNKGSQTGLTDEIRVVGRSKVESNNLVFWWNK